MTGLCKKKQCRVVFEKTSAVIQLGYYNAGNARSCYRTWYSSLLVASPKNKNTLPQVMFKMVKNMVVWQPANDVVWTF